MYPFHDFCQEGMDFVKDIFYIYWNDEMIQGLREDFSYLCL